MNSRTHLWSRQNFSFRPSNWGINWYQPKGGWQKKTLYSHIRPCEPIHNENIPSLFHGGNWCQPL